MADTVNYISKLTLPNGTVVTLKDAEARNLISNLDLAKVGADGSYIKFVSQEDGLVSAEKAAFETSIVAGETKVNAPSAKAVEDRIQSVVNSLDYTSAGKDGSYIQKVSETNGKISETVKSFASSVTADGANAPTSAAVKNYVDTVVAGIKGFSFFVVDTLPTASEDTRSGIYLVKHAHSTSDSYDEYITLRSGTAEPYTYTWEKIGNTDIDLSGYIKGVNSTFTGNSKEIISGVNLTGASYTPKGSVTITGAKYTPAGSVSSTASYTPAGSVASTASYTPAGTVDVKGTTASVVTGVSGHKDPSLSFTVDSVAENLTIGWDAGALGTLDKGSVVSGISSATFTGTQATISSNGTLAGTKATITSSGTLSGTAATISPTATFSGDAATIAPTISVDTESYTPSGTITNTYTK